MCMYHRILSCFWLLLALGLVALPQLSMAAGPPVSPTDFAALVSNDLPPVVPTAIPALSPWGTAALIVMVALLLWYFTMRRTRGLARVAILSVLLVCASIAVVRADSVTTLLGNAVIHVHRPLATERDFTDAEKAAVAATIAARHPAAVKLSEATIAYNAHGKSFDRRGAWINNDAANQFITDGYSLVTGPAQVGDLVVYQNGGSIRHTGIVTAVDGNGNVTEVQSKWGSAGEYFHQIREIPADYGLPSIFRRKGAAPDCDNVQPTRGQIKRAVADALHGLHNSWGDPLEFRIFELRVEADLNCSLRSPPQGGALLHSVAIRESAAGPKTGVFYCGPGNSGTTNHLPTVSTCLNEGCFEHDGCYTDKCVHGVCYWSRQSLTCDSSLLAACSGNCELVTMGDLVVCEWVFVLMAKPNPFDSVCTGCLLPARCDRGSCVGANCGNSARDEGEECDGFDDLACMIVGASCLSNCRCSNQCGNNVVENGEQCDGTDDTACPGQCNPLTCQCNVQQSLCGNNALNSGEECDGTAPGICSGFCRADCTCDPCRPFIEPDSYHVTAAATTCTADFSFTVHNPVGCPTLTGTSSVIEIGSLFAVVGGNPFNITAGGSQQIVLRFCPIAVGQFDHQLVIATDRGVALRSLSGTGGPVPVCGNGTVEGDEVCDPPDSVCGPTDVCGAGCITCDSICQFMTAPDALTLAAVVGTCVDQSFTLQNQAGCAAITGTVTNPSPPFSVVAGSPINIADGGSGDVTVRFCPTSSGHFDNLLSFQTSLGTFVRVISGDGQICGNDIREGSEQCDGIDKATCTGNCLGDCTCETLSPLPDLIVSVAPSLLAGTPQGGFNLTFIATVRNQGQAATPSGFSSKFYVDYNNDNVGPIQLSNGRFADEEIAPPYPASPPLTNASPGDTAQVISGAWTAIEGTHRIIVCADDPDNIVESSNTNNCSNTSGVGTIGTGIILVGRAGQF